MMVASGVINGFWAIAFTLGAPLLASQSLHATVGTYGLMVGAYGVGNVLANLVVGSLPIHRHVRWFFAGKLVLAGGFLLMASASVLPVILIGSGVAAIGGPMGDIPLLTLLQTEIHPECLGKTYSLRRTLSYAGVLVGTLLAVPWFTLTGVRGGIAGCALLIAATGIIGLMRFSGRREHQRTGVSPVTSSVSE